MKTMREKFEEFPAILGVINRGIYFCKEDNMYKGGTDSDYYWANGAWYAFQDQQKKIDEALEYINNEHWVDEYGDQQCPAQRIKELLNESQQE